MRSIVRSIIQSDIKIKIKKNSPYLTAKYYIYINVKIYASIKSIKYIYKYIYKGSDCTTLRLIDSDKVS